MRSERPSSCSPTACRTKAGPTVDSRAAGRAARNASDPRPRRRIPDRSEPPGRPRLFRRRAPRGRPGRLARAARLCAGRRGRPPVGPAGVRRPDLPGRSASTRRYRTATPRHNLLGAECPHPSSFAARSPALHVTRTPAELRRCRVRRGLILLENSLLDRGLPQSEGRQWKRISSPRAATASACICRRSNARLALARPVRALDAQARRLMRAFTRAVSPRLPECAADASRAHADRRRQGGGAAAAYEQALPDAGV